MYAVLARYYDVLHRDLTDDVPLVLALAAQTNGAVLELGCGTGRLMEPLVAAGVAVTGVDNSAEMLTIAQSKLNSPLTTFVQADMTAFNIPQTFGLIVISHNTLMHLNQTQLTAALQCIKQHLASDGKLLIDVENPLAMALIADQETFEAEAAFIDPESGLTVTPFARWKADVVQQVVQVDWEYVRADGLVHSAEIRYHYHLPHLMQRLLSKTGLRWHTAYGDYDQSLYNEASPRLILIATPI